jgi:hypothetical protein
MVRGETLHAGARPSKRRLRSAIDVLNEVR